jgi:hypothetical protein
MKEKKDDNPHKVYIQGPSIVNLDYENLVLRVSEADSVSWKCEGKLGIDAKCSFNRGNKLVIAKPDMKTQIY